MWKEEDFCCRMGWLRPVFCGSVNEKVKFNTSLLGTNSIYNKNNEAKLYHWSIIVVFFKYYISATKIKKEIEKDMLNGQSVGLIFSYGFKKTWKYSLSIKLKHKSKNEIKKYWHSSSNSLVRSVQYHIFP